MKARFISNSESEIDTCFRGYFGFNLIICQQPTINLLGKQRKTPLTAANNDKVTKLGFYELPQYELLIPGVCVIRNGVIFTETRRCSAAKTFENKFRAECKI